MRNDDRVGNVRTIDDARIEFQNGAQLVISAQGTVDSTGWTNGRLEPRAYVKFPPDGIQDLDFTATPPAGSAMQEVISISATMVWKNPPPRLKGVRIHAAANFREACASTLFRS